ncbi:MAG: hypothetical protein MSC30_19895 [Gaiellaceae bacterium MAG52_C11]|nr:hypothetical protein [Candidatus Gaiellasilicea maunaloa]
MARTRSKNGEDKAEGLKARVEEQGGPPEGVVSLGVQFLHDLDQRTAVVIQRFASEEDMRTSEQALEAMDPEGTPGNRASIDCCTVAVEVDA